VVERFGGSCCFHLNGRMVLIFRKEFLPPIFRVEEREPRKFWMNLLPPPSGWTSVGYQNIRGTCCFHLQVFKLQRVTSQKPITLCPVFLNTWLHNLQNLLRTVACVVLRLVVWFRTPALSAGPVPCWDGFGGVLHSGRVVGTGRNNQRQANQQGLEAARR
jgi:hypothetical protein